MNYAKLSAWTLSIFLTLSTAQAWSYSNSIPTSEHGPIAHTAKVVETMSSAGYTYIRVEENGVNYWIALPQTKVTVGEQISFYEQMLMEGFTSRSLNRTFDRILFVQAINKGDQLPTQSKAKPSPNRKTLEQHFETQQPKDPGKSVGQFSIRDIFDKKAELSGKVIEVKGKIVKISQQIMGRDWVHIEDGSGTELEKNNKLIFRTTQADVSIDDEVVAKGVLFTNKDFGYGYYYPVIIEDSIFTQ